MAYNKAYIIQTTTGSPTMNRIAATLVAMTAAAAVLLGPAPSYAADEPAPPNPCAAVQTEADYWRGAYTELLDTGSAERMRIVAERNAWQDRAVDLAHQLGQRTEERDRILRANQVQSKRIVRLKARVAELRAMIRNEPVS